MSTNLVVQCKTRHIVDYANVLNQKLWNPWIVRAELKGSAEAGLKTTVIENELRRIFRVIFHEKSVDSLHENMKKHSFRRIYELFLSQPNSELLEQMKRNSPFDFLETFIAPKEVNTLQKEKSLMPNQYSRTKLKHRSLKKLIPKVFDWLQSANMIPCGLKSFRRYQIEKNQTIWNQIYVRGNQDLFHLVS